MQTVEPQIDFQVILPWRVSMKIAVLAVCTGRSWNEVVCRILEERVSCSSGS